MAKKPAGLIYGVDDRPPASALALLAVQHIFLMSSTLVLPIVLVTEIGGDLAEVTAVVALTMIACGIGTILQAMRWRGIGSGFLCPNLCGPNFFAASVGAAWLGGLPLMRGMTIVAGVVELVFARLVHRLAFLFPTEITGLVVFMVGISLIPVGTSKFLHIDYSGEPIQPISFLAAGATLLVMVALTIWGGAKLRLYSVLIGMALGYALSAAAGLLPADRLERVAGAPWVGVPVLEHMFDVTFRWSLVPAFVIVSICGALKSFGNLIMCEKVNDDEWKEPDIKRIGDGLVADGLCVTLSGVLRGVASDTSSSNVSLASASGATSRYIGYAAGGIVHPARLFPQARRAVVDHARPGPGRDRGVRHLLHGDVGIADHSHVQARHQDDLRDRRGIGFRPQSRHRARPLRPRAAVDAALVRFLAHARHGGRRDPQPAASVGRGTLSRQKSSARGSAARRSLIASHHALMPWAAAAMH